MGPLRNFFASQARQALGWAALGILGIAFAAAGVFLILGSDDSRTVSADDLALPTATPAGTTTPGSSSTPSPTSSPSPAASPSVSPAATESPTPEPTPTRAATGGGGSLTGGSAPNNPTPIPPTPTPEPTPEPAVQAGGPYCDTVTQFVRPTRIFGLLRMGGADAPAGTAVTVLFDGVPGPTENSPATGGYRVDWGVGGSACANRVGASISIAVQGSVFATPFTVGADIPSFQFDIVTP